MPALLAPNVNFIPTSPRDTLDPQLSALPWDMAEFRDRLTHYGYDGAELHWISAARHCRELRAASPKQAQAIGNIVVTSHEGWRGTADPQPSASSDRPRRDLPEKDSLVGKIGSALLLPTGAASLDRLEETETKLGRGSPMHYVLFPDEKGRVEADQEKTGRFPNSSIQPTTDVGASWDVQTIGDFVRQLRTRGYQATLDGFHISRRGKIVDGKPRWRALAELLLLEKLVPEVHVSVGRTDFKNVDPERCQISIAEMRALAENGDLSNTPLGELFDLLTYYTWSGNVVIEATMPGLKDTFGKLTPNLVSELHKGMTTGVRQALPHITWDTHLTKKAAPNNLTR